MVLAWLSSPILSIGQSCEEPFQLNANRFIGDRSNKIRLRVTNQLSTSHMKCRPGSALSHFELKNESLKWSNSFPYLQLALGSLFAFHP